jgi:hypothetical protein
VYLEIFVIMRVYIANSAKRAKHINRQHVNIWGLSVNFAIFTSYKPNISIYTFHHKKYSKFEPAIGMGPRPSHPRPTPRAGPVEEPLLTEPFLRKKNSKLNLTQIKPKNYD